MKAISALIAITILITSCDDNSKDNLSCGCEGVTIEILNEIEGTIKEEAFGFVILNKNDNKRYGECFDLIDDFKIEGLQIIFSGERRATCPNVKYFAIPFKLDNIQKL